jgi:hypothetical protein
MGMTLAFVLSLPGLLGQAEPSAPAAAPQETRETEGTRPVLPGENGHILKMTREMLELAKTRDSERRMDLFLRQAQERLREREALEKAAPAPERDRLGRGLGESYAKLAGTGAAGAIECGAAEGRDMSAAAARYVLAARRHEERWSRLAGAQAPQERAHYEEALGISSKAPERVREAQEAGKAFLAREEARSREHEHEKTPETPKAPAPPKGPSEPPAPPSEPGRRDPDGDRKDKDRKADAKEPREPKAPEHHETHPHRPHR